MKKLTLIFCCILITYSAFSQTLDSQPTSKIAVLEFSPLFVDCGIMAMAYGLKFKLINTNYFFVVIIPCPEAYGKYFFIQGNKYIIETSKITNIDSAYRDYTIVNPYKKYNLPTYSVVNIKKHK